MSLAFILKRIVPAPLKQFVRVHLLTNITPSWIQIANIKAQALQQHANEIKTLSLGSSHGEFGFDPYPGSFNLCLSSQDLYYSYKLYQKFAPKLPQLKNVILFYSAFSPGFEVDKTTENERCSHYKAVFRIPYKNRALEYSPRHILLNRNGRRYMVQHPANCATDFLGKGELLMTPLTETELEQRIKGHYKHNRRGTNQTKFVAYMASLAKANKHRLIVVIPPCQKSYTNKMPDAKELFAELFQLQTTTNEPFEIMNFYTDDQFTNQNFVDSDHLNPSGAAKLTVRIKNQINSTGSPVKN